jgi:hypothetical protein
LGLPVQGRDVDGLQRQFWSELIARTWQESPTRGQLLDQYRSTVLMTSREPLFLAWRKGQSLVRVSNVRGFRSCRFRGKMAETFSALKTRCRVTRHAADKWECPTRQKLVWCPVEDSSVVEEVGDVVSVADLLEYEGLVASAVGPPETWYDVRYGVGYR